MKPQLIPLVVPWMISPSVSFMKWVAEEDGDAVVEFEIAMLDDRGDGTPPANRVRIVFVGGQWLRTFPAASDLESMPPDLYGTDHIPLNSLYVESDYLARFDAMWRDAGACPDPRAYEVSGSEWLETSGGARFGCRHYVLVGHDGWGEVLAKSYTWEYLEVMAT